MRASFERQPPRSPSIIRLLEFGGPTTVFWLVITVIVDAVDAVFRPRLQSHIGKEVFK
jgi:hypothetical protein